ncbi:sporulation protein [Flavobacterium branchiophilum]|uniref:Sporulation related protein n=1 Tax=Flavobacterium branchiophilum TaxID=55197 RepID=A0A543G414_9FLAO|nr:SPOR domain-containing protein [Flavobacterium branchiophilum]OXA75797.1 sporulation protein [Flavobacterium branchiophilum] [Flavobacterium branchiophilum NBRC 15030 = ATCC 35035]TQM40818.1 sporulation related protein [Flavobacterium branchiophilum]
MNIYTIKKSIILALFLGLFYSKSTAQESKTTLIQDQNFEKLLKERRKTNTITFDDSQYKIQIYNGDSENSKQILATVKKNNKEYDSSIVFDTPNYKVWIGNFKTRIEAERNLVILKKKYPAAFLIKPKK